jgi:hypothetical protein
MSEAFFEVRPSNAAKSHYPRAGARIHITLALSLPKIRSVWIRSMSQNHRIIRADVCDPARAVGLRCRHFQVATQAGSREPVSSSSA